MPFSRQQRGVQYDVFNGDADGICALHQLRLTRPAPEARLITGVKRDIALLRRLKDTTNSSITVLDISLDSNRTDLLRLLDAGNEVLYIDHHFAGTIPTAVNLTAHIDPAPDRCTSLIVDGLLQGAHRPWALCGAFGDNLHTVAEQLASASGLSQQETTILREIGELLNYNGYGNDLQDLYFAPDHLYQSIATYPSPFAFYEQSQTLRTLKAGFANDMAMALDQPVFSQSGANRIYRLPYSPWARRISGVFANLKARESPDGAHALITENGDGSLRISVRAPLVDRRDADTLCRQFPSGGGRAAAAGINSLPEDDLNRFVTAFNHIYQHPS